VNWKAALKKRVSTFVVGLPIIKQIVANKFQKALEMI
jgi:glutamate/tyrosine decarboxylase-like PLP-dependent enzyme